VPERGRSWLMPPAAIQGNLTEMLDKHRGRAMAVDGMESLIGSAGRPQLRTAASTLMPA
jgi:hypothetical protein